MRKIKKLNEEIARWAFEVHFNTNDNWKIAFTNPTAGPWKTIKAESLDTGEEGEVYRFDLEETRPDIILYNDSLKTIIIFEAKDSLKKLILQKQAKKSSEVVIKLATILHSSNTNKFWKGRENYYVILGLLWGSTDSQESKVEKNKLYNCYHNLIKNDSLVFHDLIIGIETIFQSENQNITCNAFYKDFSGKNTDFGDNIIESIIA